MALPGPHCTAASQTFITCFVPYLDKSHYLLGFPPSVVFGSNRVWNLVGEVSSHHNLCVASLCRLLFCGSMGVQDRESRGRKGRTSPPNVPANAAAAKVPRTAADSAASSSVAASAAGSLGATGTSAKPYNFAATPITSTASHIHIPAVDSIPPSVPAVQQKELLMPRRGQEDVDIEFVEPLLSDGLPEMQEVAEGDQSNEGEVDKMAKLVASHLEQQSAAFGQRAFEVMRPEVTALVQSTVVASMGVLQGKVTGLESGVAKLEIGVKQLGGEVAEVRADVKTMEANMLSKVEELSIQMEKLVQSQRANDNVPATPMSYTNVNGSPSSFPQSSNVFSLSGFFRALDPTTLFCNTSEHKKVSRSKFEESILKLAAEAGLGADTFDLVGDPLDNEFEIDWNPIKINDLTVASSNCTQFYASLRTRKGKRIVWKPQNVLDDQNQLVQFYVNTDKNPSMVRKEVLTKAVQGMCQQVLSGCEVFANKPNGTLFVDRKRLCTVHVTGENSARLEWNTPICVQFKFEYGPVEEAFKALLLNQGLSSS